MDVDTEPPAKRRRTSQDGSDYSRSPDPPDAEVEDRTKRHYTSSRSRSRERTRSRSQEHDSGPQSYRQRSPSNDYTPRSRRSYTHSLSHSPPQHARKPKLTFTPLFSIPAAHARGITSAKFSPDSTLLATASADASINIYSVPPSPTPGTPFKLLRTLRSHKAGINALSWSPIGPPYTLASASDDKSVLIWSPLSSDFPIPPSPLTGHSNYVYSLAFSPKGNMLVTGSFDEAVFLWDVRSARVMRQLPAHSDPVSGVDFVRDGTMVCSCASDGLIRIWDAGTGQCLKTLVHEDRKAVTAVRFSPNGRYVLAWTLDSCVRLWRYLGADGGGCVKTYQGHVNTGYSLGGTIGEYTVFDDEGGRGVEAFVASGSEDGDVFVWDINSKEVLWKASGHKDVVLSVEWTMGRDGRGLLATVGKDRELKVWIEDVDPNLLQDVAVEESKEDVDIQGHMVQLEIKREDTEMEG